MYSTTLDRLLIPNRYPSSLVKMFKNEIQEERECKMEILNLWKNRYAFSRFISFKDEIIMVRSSSLSIFREV